MYFVYMTTEMVPKQHRWLKLYRNVYFNKIVAINIIDKDLF